jgi:hypothetical protein
MSNSGMIPNQSFPSTNTHKKRAFKKAGLGNLHDEMIDAFFQLPHKLKNRHFSVIGPMAAAPPEHLNTKSSGIQQT